MAGRPESFMPLFLLFLAVPLIEIALFILIGGKIGVFATLAMVVVTAIAGSALLRWQGIQTLNRIRNDMENRRLPARPIADGAMIALAGLLLLTPGFFTDFCGFMLFVPGVRTMIWRQVASRIQVFDARGRDPRGPDQHGWDAGGRNTSGRAASERPGARKGETIDLDESEFQAEPDPDSPWRGDRN
jgi:UPF0716 protein FxsA